MQQSINEVKESIQEAELATIQYNNEARQLRWDIFDFLLDRISKVNDEAEFLIGLMDSTKLYTDNGQLTDTGMATMGLHGQSYNAYMQQAEEYKKEIERIERELSESPYDTKLIERREELISLVQESISAAEDEKDAIVDMVREGIEIELDALQKLIDKRKENLNAMHDEYEYSKKIAEQNKAVTDIQKQLTAYEGDNSEENKARLQELRNKLKDAQDELEESQYDKYIEDQNKMLDELFENYSNVLNSVLDNVDQLIINMTERINTNASDIMDTLREQSDKVGYTISQAITDIWSGDNNPITYYMNSFADQMTNVTGVLTNIETFVKELVQKGDSTASSDIPTVTPSTETVKPPVDNTPTPPPQTEPPVQDTPTTDNKEEEKKKVKVVKGQWYVRTGPGTSYKKLGIAHTGDKLKYRGEKTGSWYAVKYKKQNAWISSKGSKLVGYSKGGYVADAQRMAYRNGDNIVTMNTLKKGEAVLTPEQANLFSKFVNYLPQAQNMLDISSLVSKVSATRPQQGISVGDVSFNMNVDHVEDYNDLVRQMQKDNQFERFIQSLTVDRLTGGSKLAKHKFSWK